MSPGDHESQLPHRMARRILLIVNPQAAFCRPWQQCEGLLASLQHRWGTVEHLFTAGPRHAVELARQASPHYEVIVAVGGDGMVNEVANGILQGAGTRPKLGLVPAGTGNDIAQQVGIRSFEEAGEALLGDRLRALDVIEVRCQQQGQPVTHYALLFGAIGFASALIKMTTPAVKRFFGRRLCYSVGFFRALHRYRAPLMQVTVNGQTTRDRLFHVGVGNCESAGGGVMRLSPGARTDDGQLNVCLVENLGRWEITRYFPRLVKGTFIGHPKVRYFPATALSVATDPVADVQLDGDLVGQTPVTFQVKPSALHVLTTGEATIESSASTDSTAPP
jgi:diacylglycerol kinase (ATP)